MFRWLHKRNEREKILLKNVVTILWKTKTECGIYDKHSMLLLLVAKTWYAVLLTINH